MVGGVIQPLRPYQENVPAPPPTAPAAPEMPEEVLRDMPISPSAVPRRVGTNGRIPGVKMVDGVIQPLRPYQGMGQEGLPASREEPPEAVLRDIPIPPAPKQPPRQNGRIPGVKMVDGVIQPLRPYQGMDPSAQQGPPRSDMPEELLLDLKNGLPPPTPPPAARHRVRENDADLLRINGVIQPLRPYQEDAPTPPPGQPPPPASAPLENWEDWEHLFH